MKLTKEDIVDLDVPMCLEDTPEGKGIRLTKLREVVKELRKIAIEFEYEGVDLEDIDERFGDVME